jgi:hypothetical protein
MKFLMKRRHTKRQPRAQLGVALLIAIMALLLISVVAMSMIVGAGMETSLAGNYRASSAAYYAAMAGMEEARGRLTATNANYFGATVQVPIPVGTAYYITNPVGGENVLTSYPDTEFANTASSEFPSVSSPIIQTVASVSGNNTAGIPGALYKWVRINGVTEASTKLDVNHDGFLDPTTLLYYDPANPCPSNPATACPGMIVPSSGNIPQTAKQVLEITSLAVLPSGNGVSTQKLLQYYVTQQTYNVNFPSGLFLAGNGVNFQGGSSSNWQATGADQCASPQNSLPSLGYTNPADLANFILPKPSDYTGSSVAPPGTNNTTGASTVVNVSGAISGMPQYQNLQTPMSLDAMMQNITQSADAVITGPATPASAGWPTWMSPTNPATIVVNGDYSMSNYTGYGLLAVTGNYAANGNTVWNGIVMVVGQGSAAVMGTDKIYGGVLVAKTRDSSGTELATLGASSYTVSGFGHGGIYYNSCLISQTQSASTYRVLSFREVPYAN